MIHTPEMDIPKDKVTDPQEQEELVAKFYSPSGSYFMIVFNFVSRIHNLGVTLY